MTEPTLADPPTQTPTHPAEVLTNLIIALLAPIFLVASGGDIAFARKAAADTVNQYRVRNQLDLIVVAQLIAFSLTALGSLSLSLPENLPLATMIRLRANAVALNRAAENARRTLRDMALQTSQPQPANLPDVEFEDNVRTGVADAQQRATDALARFQTAEPEATIVPAPAPAPAQSEHLTQWASAMTNVAHEFTANLENLSPAERQEASRRAAVLTDVANQLLSGHVPERPRPGDAYLPLRPGYAPAKPGSPG